jgi:hypothetical protein
MSPATVTRFTRRGEDAVGARSALVFDFSVNQYNSHWIIATPGGQQFSPPYKGSVWIDKATRKVLRIRQVADSFPSGFGMDRAETTVEYGYMRIGLDIFLLPMSGETVGCQRGGNCSRNLLEFHNYRKFGSESSIKFD